MSNSAADPPTLCSYLNLSVSYNEFLSGENQLLLFLYALGGTDIPDLLLSSVEFTQRRWTADGEIEEITASGLNVPPELVNILSDRGRSSDLMGNPNVTHQVLDDGTVTWSLCTDIQASFSQCLLPQTMTHLGDMALKLMCLACPPCYEGNTNWYETRPQL